MKGSRKEWESPPGRTEHGHTGKKKRRRLQKKINNKKMSSAEGKAAETAAEVAAE
jgi:hypothetical protein